MKAFQAPFLELAEADKLIKDRMKTPGMIQIAGCLASQKVHLAYALGQDIPYKLYVVSDELMGNSCLLDFLFFDSNVWFYPAKDLLFHHADVRGPLIQQKQMEVVQAILLKKPMTIVTTFDALMATVTPLTKIEEQIVNLEMGGDITFEEVKEKLFLLGYERVDMVEERGQVSVRGGIIDVWAMTEELPIRIEFWGDEMDGIRTFDVESQRMIDKVEKIAIFPADEKDEATIVKQSFLQYFSKEEVLLFLDEPSRLIEQGEALEAELREAYDRRTDLQSLNMDEVLFSTSQVIGLLAKYYSFGLTVMDTKCKEIKSTSFLSLVVKSIPAYNRSFDLLSRDLKRFQRQKYRVILLSPSRSRAKRLAEDLRDYDINSFYSDDLNRVIQPGEVMVGYGHLGEGYEYPLIRFLAIAEKDIFGSKNKKKKRAKREGKGIQNFADLHVGDYVVHENHGLGMYMGLEKILIDNVEKDYLKISYAGESNLYILVSQMDLLQKYGSNKMKKPKLNRLGGKAWGNTKARVQKAIEEVAADLVDLYALRQEREGFAFEKDSLWQKEFEEMFDYEETDDQLAAISATKHDMESTAIMDRLICGDVGYGKTEIAIRAAFKAVQDNKQVAYLVPTTILAQQHYNTFVQRMKDYPVRVELLCRFRTPKQQKEALEGLEKGLVDIVIGTHRLVSKDVTFKDLGLLVIDEEQRFGVRHKEAIKQMKEKVDVLTLTATPIPRTLHMSLIGIRDMSVLDEPPEDRMPIQTYVMEYQEEVVREAIQRELSRGGQVYYVFNRIHDIADISLKIEKMLPAANVAYAHGKMPEHKLEKIMVDFIAGDIDVLVSTTIIETGLDISNVNTIIIHDANRLGLAQLYQLRGRVGRSNRMAYAFLLYPRQLLLSETAEKRLMAIRENTDLGSGYKIAMRDLEIRGVGNLLGEAQSGHMEAIGYDLYCKMLQIAVKHLKGEKVEDSFSTTVDLNVDAFIPITYIPNEFQRLDVYKRIASIENEEEASDMVDELIDRFGDLPPILEQLIEIAILKADAHNAYVTSIEQSNDIITFRMYEFAKVIGERIPEILSKYNGNLIFRGNEKPFFRYHKKGGASLGLSKKEILPLVKNIIADLLSIIESS